MCDFSLQAIKSRPAKVADKLVTKNFGTGTTGFCAVDDADCAVCVMPGTEIAFDAEPAAGGKWSWNIWKAKHKVAIFRQINKDIKGTHHDALEFPDGEVKLLTGFNEGVTATVLQLPAAPRNEQEEIDQTRVAFAG